MCFRLPMVAAAEGESYFANRRPKGTTFVPFQR